MFKIAICEDEKIIAETQAKLCGDILNRMNIDGRVMVFENGENFLAAFSAQREKYDLILLDIVMEGLNGMELAGNIRESDKETDIIFITSKREYAIEGYDVGALHYLVKPVDAGALGRLIRTVYEKKYKAGYFILKSGTQNHRIAIKSVIALETVGRKTEITTTAGSFFYSGKLSEILSKLKGDDFIRCHQAFAVNISNIREIDRFEAIAVNGKRVPISRAYLKDVKTAFLATIQGN